MIGPIGVAEELVDEACAEDCVGVCVGEDRVDEDCVGEDGAADDDVDNCILGNLRVSIT